MPEIKLIVCPIDFSEFSTTAYCHAVSLAEHYRSKLVAQHIVDLWRHPSMSFAASAMLYEEYCRALCESGKVRLREFVSNQTAGDIQRSLSCTRQTPRTQYCRLPNRKERT